MEALRRGDSSQPHAWPVDQACAELPDEAAAAVAASCQLVLLRGTKRQVEKAVRAAVTRWHIEHPDPDERPDSEGGLRSARDKRAVESFASHLPGMAFVLALMPTEDAAALMARLEEAVRLAKAASDQRTPDQIAADTLAAFGWHGLPHEDLLDLLRQADAEAAAATAAGATDAVRTAGPMPAEDPVADSNSGAAVAAVPAGHGFWGSAGPPATPTLTPTPLPVRDPVTGLTAAQLALLRAVSGEVRAHVHATVSLETLLGLREALADIATSAPGHRGTDLGPVPADLARPLAARPDSLWDRFLHDESGVLLGVTPGYPVPATLRRTVLAEYVTCTFYGCPRPAAECDTDHVRDWADGGQTEQANVHPADRSHHNLKTHGGWQVERDPDGTITWTSPFGQTVTIDPHDYRPHDPRPGWR